MVIIYVMIRKSIAHYDTVTHIIKFTKQYNS